MSASGAAPALAEGSVASRFEVGRPALVRSAIAPILGEPLLNAAQTSQLVLGMRIEVVGVHGLWIETRSEDGYLGWVHSGYLRTGTDEWAYAWERGTAGEPVVSIGAELLDSEGNVIVRLPWGARLIRRAGACQLPDGRSGVIGHGEVVDVDRLADRFPPRADSVARTARRWLGAPYLWGGVTPAGVDCSGFTQAVMWMHGVALPRDSVFQEGKGALLPIDSGLDALRPADLLYFAAAGEPVRHVAISLGGSVIIHAAVTNGGVQIDDLDGSQPLERDLRATLVSARRMLPDGS
jgi:gamma-D-glutamyl-L-lysine dipeptidyl-peptidase